MVDDEDSNGFPHLLPGKQYSATLRRRAIRKMDESCPSECKNLQGEEGEEEEEGYGDTSLGMKLIIIGGKVIVQSLDALSDGRKSPAQLAGNIRRGDVLVSIDELSIVGLPIDRLIEEGLRPLKFPMSGPGGNDNDLYKRVVELRFESGTGMELLKRHEEGMELSKLHEEGGGHNRSTGNSIFSPILPYVENFYRRYFGSSRGKKDGPN